MDNATTSTRKLSYPLDVIEMEAAVRKIKEMETDTIAKLECGDVSRASTALYRLTGFKGMHKDADSLVAAYAGIPLQLNKTLLCNVMQLVDSHGQVIERWLI